MARLSTFLIGLVSVVLVSSACAQTIPQLPPATVPLSGSELMAVSQGGVTKKATVLNVRGSPGVTSITCGAGLIGGTITATGTCSVDTTIIPTLSGTNHFSGSNTFTGTFIAPACTGTVSGLVPSTTPVGKVLTDNCTWQTVTGVGTVTSVQASGGSTGLTFSGGPITDSGTLTEAGTLNVGHGGTGITSVPSNGQIPIGNGSNYVASTLTAGSNITITNGSGGITIAAAASNGGVSTIYDIDKTYGGDPTGVSDTTTAFNAAKAACLSTTAGKVSGGTIWMGGGNHSFTQQITISGNCNFESVGPTSSLVTVSGISGDWLTIDPAANGISVGGFQVVNGGSWTTGYAVNCCGPSNRIHDLWTVGTPHNLHHSVGSETVFERVNFTDSVLSPSVLCDNNRGNIYGARWSNSQISTVVGIITSGTYNSGTGAVVLTFGASPNLKVGASMLVSGLTGTGAFAGINGTYTITGVTGTTISFTASTGLGASTITGGIVNRAGITGFEQGLQCNSFTFNNVATLFTDTCFLADNNTVDTESFTVMDDFECDASQHGIIFNGSSGINIVNSYSLAAAGSGISFGSTFAGFASISNSQLRDSSAYGILNNGTSGSVQITGNTISGNAGGNIAIGSNVKNFMITGNKIQIPGAFDPTASYGIFIGAGTSDYYSVQSNVCYAPSLIVPLSDGGTGVNKIVGMNPGC